jgi:hypothetical protein
MTRIDQAARDSAAQVLLPDHECHSGRPACQVITACYGNLYAMGAEGKPCQIPAGFAIVRLPDEMVIKIKQLGSSETMMQKKRS